MDKDAWVIENFAPKNRSRKARNFVQPVTMFKASRKTRLVMCLLGGWSASMPPYNLARLAAITRGNGYYTKTFDFNIDTYYDLKSQDPSLADAYTTANYWWWSDPHFSEKILPIYKDILYEYLDKILEEEPDIVGFSTYYTNNLSTRWMVKELRQRRPDITIIMGGPECHEGHFVKPDEVDYYFVGESEKTLIQFLNDWEEGIKPPSAKIGSLYGQERVDLDSLPFPDYSDFQLYKYSAHNTICAEISRGCVAKCTYCSEVYFWKFRDRDSVVAVDEIQYQIEKNDTKFIYFVDSLMNGNLKEFRRFCEEIVARKIKIGWWGYARIDGRMDLEFFKLMKAAGAGGFNYGIESGSDKVLKLVNKKNTVAEINQNLIDSKEAGLKVSACWVIGAPGEEIEDFAHSYNCLWNHRERIYAVSPGPGLGDTIGSAYDDRERFNMNPRGEAWLGGWYTLDLKNTQLHRYIRIKLMHLWLDLCHDNGTIVNVHKVGETKDHYDLTPAGMPWKEVEYEYGFDYNIIQTDFGDFADSSMNEVFGFLRMLWRVKGAYEIKIRFDPEKDRKDFVFAFNPDKFTYDADIHFKVDQDGNYEVENSYSFQSHDTKLIDGKDYKYVYKASGKW